MISDFTRKQMSDAVASAAAYSKGRQRKQLQSAYDKLLDELSQHFFQEPCAGRMDLRQKMNALDVTGLDKHAVETVSAVRTMQVEQPPFEPDTVA
jgi:hypothetical protein